MQKICDFIKRKKTAIVISLCNTVILLSFTYWINNKTYFTGENVSFFSWLEFGKTKVGIEHDDNFDDVVFINVAYDKTLIEAYDSKALKGSNYHIRNTVGVTDITDRSALLKFLQMLRQRDKYTYIFLDVKFEKGYEVPEIDSLLFAEIRSMRDIVVANHKDIDVIDGFPLEKAGFNDYKTHITSNNFGRYKCLYKDKPSMALYAYRDLTGKDIKEHFWGYSCDSQLCFNSLFLEFQIKDNIIYKNLGKNMLENSEVMINATDGKYIFIGDMVEDDLHDTYAGKKTGAEITYKLFQALMEGKHIVSWHMIVLLALVFYMISFLQFCHEPVLLRIRYIRERKPKVLLFIFSFIEYTALLTVAALVIDMKSGIIISILVPSIYFSIQKNIIAYRRFKL